MQVATRFVKCRSWLVKITVPWYSSSASASDFDGIDVEMVARLVENQDVVVRSAASPARQSRARSPPDRTEIGFLTCAPRNSKAPATSRIFLILLAGGGLFLEIVENGLVLRQAGVDVLGVDADLAAVAPADFARQRLERIHHGPQERRFSLAVVADDGGPRAVIDLQLDVGGDLPFGIADRQIAAAQSRTLARLDARRADPGRRFVAGDLRQFQAFELLALGLRQRRGAGAGLVPGDEVFQVLAFGDDRRRSSVPRARAVPFWYSR